MFSRSTEEQGKCRVRWNPPFSHQETSHRMVKITAATADETYTLASPGTIKVFESSNVRAFSADHCRGCPP